MVLQFSKMFNFGGPTLHRPLINQMPISNTSNASVGISSVLAKKQQMWRWFKDRTELNSPVQIRVDDTITDIEFFSKDGEQLGRNKAMEARRFWEKNQLNQRLKTLQFDRLVTGSGFLWKGSLKNQEKEVIKVAESIASQFEFYQMQTKELKDLAIKAVIDEDLRLPRKIDNVASSTVLINHDKHEIIGYTQHFLATQVNFTPDEIVHIPLYSVDGKVDGFTPVEAMGREFFLLWAIKENMISFIRNGGSPNKAWILPEEMANSPNHQWLVQELSNKGILQNRHGNLVLTGKVESLDLEPNLKDMEYQNLALYVTSLVAYGLRVPVSRIPFLIGTAASKGDSGGMAESGYWSMIDSDQKTIEEAINQQILEELGWRFRFIRRYKIDDLRETQAANFRMDYVTKMASQLRQQKQKIKTGKLVSLLSGNENSISLNDLEEMSPDELMLPEQKTGLLNQSFMKDRKVEPSGKQQGKDETKREGAKNNPKSSLQTGF